QELTVVRQRVAIILQRLPRRKVDRKSGSESRDGHYRPAALRDAPNSFHQLAADSIRFRERPAFVARQFIKRDIGGGQRDRIAVKRAAEADSASAHLLENLAASGIYAQRSAAGDGFAECGQIRRSRRRRRSAERNCRTR